MNWTSLAPLAGSLARAGLPALATVLGTVLPPPFDLVAGAAFKLISAAVGVDAAAPDAPSQVQAAVDASPADAVTKLQAIEQAHKDAADAFNRELELRLADVQNARSTEAEYVKAGSFMQAVPGIWTLVVALTFCGTLSVLILRPVAMTEVVGGLVNTLLGILIGELTRCGNFWLGSSQSSRLRADQAIDFAHKASATSSAHRK